MLRTVARALTLLVLFFWSSATAPLRAELVLLVGGGVLKVDSYRLRGDQIELVLPSGGLLTLSVLRIDRILADEIDREAANGLPTSDLAWRFSDSQPVPRTPYGGEIFAVARRYELNPVLVAAVVEAESAFDPWAVSIKGASGLMQLMPSTAERFGLSGDQIFDPERNLDVGARYLRWLVDRFDGDLPLVLAGYNAGESAVDRYDGVPPYRETRNYIRRVFSAAGSSAPAAANE